MGCFLACFGFTNKRKKRKSADKKHGSYEPLDSSVSIVRLVTAENLTTSADFEPRHKPKEQLSSKIRKKVRFNLNVQAYEPISTSYHFLKDEEDEKVEKKHEEIKEGSLSTSLFGSGSSNLNYRYQNCRDFYDDIAFEDSDLDDYDIDYIDDNDDEYDGDSDIDSQRVSKDGMSSEKKVSSDEHAEEKAKISDKSDYAHSVLKPVENLTQWRAAKAKAATPSKQHQRKENNLLSQEFSEPLLVQERQPRNQSKPLLQEIAVDSSLSSWLSSRNT
ncbi:hypothetical protein L484_003721 [Morus notabilis]|uniref:Uncharacterized protein n=1 Tax=Morus notabilis TaxID=981085 RepID=W9SB96_9ROSA|nr:uncharacterized protein LOC21387245 [Morus notabilis]EXC24413.1 hypothetical protein L484_003721 [Morus notabilis]